LATTIAHFTEMNVVADFIEVMLIVMCFVLCALWRNSWAWLRWTAVKPSLCVIILRGIVLRLVKWFWH